MEFVLLEYARVGFGDESVALGAVTLLSSSARAARAPERERERGSAHVFRQASATCINIAL